MKKGAIIGGFAGLVVLGAIIGSCGGDEPSNTNSNASKGTEKTSQVINENTVNDSEDVVSKDGRQEGKYYAGDVIEFTNGALITINDTGIAENLTSMSENFVYLYVDVTVENVGTEDITISPGEMTFYQDNEIINQEYTWTNFSDAIQQATISPGRKTSGKFYIECYNYGTSNQIEAELGDAVIVIRDVENDANAVRELIYGTFHLRNGNDEGGWCDAEVDCSSEGRTYLTITMYEDGANVTGTFVGKLVKKPDGTYYAMEEGVTFPKDVTVSFSEYGMEITPSSNTMEEGLECLYGFYDIVEAYDYSHAS
ncbi:MAG: DUF4352 domain-containing protein [Lachnospiraceae bacterium]|nr:DUF4352 domain-containing protein [Lachnospiraceae bacterium]